MRGDPNRLQEKSNYTTSHLLNQPNRRNVAILNWSDDYDSGSDSHHRSLSNLLNQPNRRMIDIVNWSNDYDLGSNSHYARRAMRSRYSHPKRQPCKESRKRRSSVSTSKNFNEDSNSQRPENISNVEFNTKVHPPRAGPSRNNYGDGDYEEVNEDNFLTPNVGPSTMRRRYGENSNEDSDLEGIEITISSNSEGLEITISSDSEGLGITISSSRAGDEDDFPTPSVSPSTMRQRYRGPLTNNYGHGDNEEVDEDDFPTPSISPSTMRRRYRGPLTNNYGQGDNEEVDEDDFLTPSVSPLTIRRRYRGPSRNNYEDHEEEDEDDSLTPSVSPSTIRRRYRANHRRLLYLEDGDDIAPAKGSFTWKNCELDVANTGNIMCRELVNHNIIACPNEESSCIASRTLARTICAKKAAEIGSEEQIVPSRNENEDEMKGSPGENEENNTILADNELSGEEPQADTNLEREGSSINNVPNEQCEEGSKAASGEHEENNTILADNELLGEELQVSTNLEREGSSLNNVQNEQREEETEHVVLKVPLRKKNIGEQSRKRKKVVPKERRVHKKSSTVPCSDQSQLAKNSSEAEEMNILHSSKQSRSNFCMQTTPGSLALVIAPAATDVIECENGIGNVISQAIVEYVPPAGEISQAIVGYVPPAGEIIKKQVKTKISSLQPNELFRALANSMLGRGPPIETESESEDESRQALPTKFRFEDEVPKQKEKTAEELEVAALFAELDLALAMVDQSLCEVPEVNLQLVCSPAEETQEARCARGSHEVMQDDEIGVYCIHCNHVELEARDVLVPWAIKKTYRGRKRSADGRELQVSVDKRRHVEPSVKNTAAIICPNEGTVWDVIPGVKEKMFEHQQEGLEYLWKHLAGSTDLAEVKTMDKPNEMGGCMISHAPGTGKTRLTIVFLETYLKVFPDSRPLIIAPASMLLTWEQEFKKWGCPFPFHNLNNNDLVGKESKKVLKQFQGLRCLKTVRMVKMFSWDRTRSVLGLSYSLFQILTGRNQEKDETNKESMAEISNEEESMRKILFERPGLVIMDEGHVARNPKTKLSIALLQLETDKRVILSGTPFQNTLSELYNLLHLVRPAVADEIAQDKELFQFNKKSNQMELLDDSGLERWKHKMLPFVNVHEGTSRQDLPGLIDSVIILKPQELQRKLIQATTEGHLKAFDLENKIDLISVHPYLFKGCDTPDIDMNLVEASKLNPNEGTKTKFIIELLRLSTAANEKVLIFCQKIPPLELIKEQLKEVFDWVEGKQVLHVEGKNSAKQRQQSIETYNNPLSEARVMLASTKCCSEGISLVGASRVVLLDVAWNPSVKRQAICRAYRIGQSKPVYTYHLMTSGTTEIDKYRRQVQKEHLSELVFCSSNGSSDKGKNQASGCMEDKILEQMVGCANLTDMFHEIINHPKENFRLTS